MIAKAITSISKHGGTLITKGEIYDIEPIEPCCNEWGDIGKEYTVEILTPDEEGFNYTCPYCNHKSNIPRGSKDWFETIEENEIEELISITKAQELTI